MGDGNKGTITVNGKAGDYVGWGNEGTITVTGTIKSLDRKASGTIIAGDVTEDHGIPWTKIT